MINQTKITISFLIALFIVIGTAQAQDAHYSQFYASPLTLNPAMTGMMNSDYRIAIIHKNQNSLSYSSGDASFKGGYSSQGLSYDMTLAKKQFKTDYFGAGILINNESLFGLIQGNSFYGSGSYHLFLNNRNLLSAGMQLGLTLKSINAFEDQIFPNQVNSGGSAYNSNLPNGENGGRSTYIDLNFGLAWLSKINRKISLINGVSMHHINGPKEQFTTGQVYRLPMRFNLHSGAKIKVMDNFQVVPNMILVMQGASQEINLGTSLEAHFPDNKSPVIIGSFGTYYRRNATNTDAFVFVLGGAYQQFNLGVSYDINVGRSALNGNKGGMEVSLAYTGGLASSNKVRLIIDCPKW